MSDDKKILSVEEQHPGSDCRVNTNFKWSVFLPFRSPQQTSCDCFWCGVACNRTAVGFGRALHSLLSAVLVVIVRITPEGWWRWLKCTCTQHGFCVGKVVRVCLTLAVSLCPRECVRPCLPGIFELQPWHRFRTPDILIHPHISAREEIWTAPSSPPTQQPSNKTLWVESVIVEMQQSKTYLLICPKCQPDKGKQ